MEKLKLPTLKKVKNIDEYVKYKVGDERNGHKVLPKDQRKKMLIIADDIRFFSGIATQSKMLVTATCHRYNWVNLGASINPPDAGQQLDISEDLTKQSGVEDATAKIIPNAGYGSPDLLREIIKHENIEAIFFVTDPRYYDWLFRMEAELHQMGIPLIYWNIWDDVPVPVYNSAAYASCDILFGISKQTTQINKTSLKHGPNKGYIDDPIKAKKIDKTVARYLKHGLNPTKFFKITEDHEDWQEYQTFLTDFSERTNIDLTDPNKFIVFWNNRNIRRKQPGNIVLGYNKFAEQLDIENKKNLALVLHTDPVDQNGTDLPAVVEAVCPDYKVVFSDRKIDDKVLNFYYNMADVIPSIASNEGFGLTSCEGLMAGTPIIVNVTGGLQDQCGFKKEDGTYISIDDLNEEWMTNHAGTYKEHGEWVTPLFPKSRALVGSPTTPYILDDYVDWEDLAEALTEWFNYGNEERERRGLLGRQYLIEEGFTDEAVANEMISITDAVLEKWVKPERWSLSKTEKISNKTYGIIYKD